MSSKTVTTKPIAPTESLSFNTGRGVTWRRCIAVGVPGRGRQAFYQSTGRNSKRPGEWLPFDGFCIPPWFDKRRFVKEDSNDPLHRYGTEALKRFCQRIQAADELGLITNKDKTQDPVELNEFLATDPSLKHARDWKAVLGRT